MEEKKKNIAGGEAETKTSSGKKKRVSAGTVVGIILCVILIPILIANVTMIVKAQTHPDRVPNFLDYAPMIVLSPSMEPQIMKGDLIIIKTVEADQVKEGDVISFFDDSLGQGQITTHRILAITTDSDGKPVFTTGGDYNKYRKEDGSWEVAEDPVPVKAEKLVGLYQMRIPKVGKLVNDMQKPIGSTKIPIGYLIFVAVPLVLLVAYELIRRGIFEKSRKKDTEALLAELEALRAQQAAQSGESKQEAPPAQAQKMAPAEAAEEAPAREKDGE